MTGAVRPAEAEAGGVGAWSRMPRKCRIRRSRGGAILTALRSALPLRSLPQPWDECDWSRIAELPRTDERLAEARRVVTVLLDEPELSPHVPQPPSPGLLWHVWEEFHQAVGKSMPRTSHVTWSGVDELVRAWRGRPQLYPLQRHVVRHAEAAMLAMIPSLRDDIADSVFRWLALDPDPRHFAEWAVGLAERCVTEDIGADSAIELLGATGSPEARAALERLSVKPGGPASWENAEAAQSTLFDLGSEVTSH
ncbi:hypothetical protein ACWKT3_30140 [Streptomyces violaceus]